MIETLNYIFNICIIIGFIIPLLNLLTGWFGGFFDIGGDVDVDVPTTDSGAVSGTSTNVGTSAIIPFNVMCLCLFLIVFGALGHIAKLFMTSLLLTILLIIACVCLAALAYWGLYVLLIKRLKNSDSVVMSLNDYLGNSAEVTLRITQDSMGTISVKDNTGAPISFRAKMDPELKSQLPDIIAQGESVVITEVDNENNLCYVSVKLKDFKKQ